MDVRGTYHHWGYVQEGINLTSIAMDYDTHNCYVTFQQREQGGKSSFAIMHMLGGNIPAAQSTPLFARPLPATHRFSIGRLPGIQKVLSTNSGVGSPAGDVAATTMDMGGNMYYTVQADLTTSPPSPRLNAYALGY